MEEECTDYSRWWYLETFPEMLKVPITSLTTGTQKSVKIIKLFLMTSISLMAVCPFSQDRLRISKTIGYRKITKNVL
jgi:hypothetical protein